MKKKQRKQKQYSGKSDEWYARIWETKKKKKEKNMKIGGVEL